jgi:hypothetical protein
MDTVVKPKVEDLEQPPPGWFVLDVMKKAARKSDWVALTIDVHPEDLAKGKPARQCWVRIPGKHRDRDTARAALDEIMGTRH